MRLRLGSSVIAAIGVAVAIGTVPSVAVTQTSLSPDTPTWWHKFQIVSAPGFTPAQAGARGSVRVGANIDVSNEAGPQSETSISVKPTKPAPPAGGANPSFRLPMR